MEIEIILFSPSRPVKSIISEIFSNQALILQKVGLLKNIHVLSSKTLIRFLRASNVLTKHWLLASSFGDAMYPRGTRK